MPFKIKIAVAALVLSLTVLASWTNSDSLYGFYLRTWHITLRGESSYGALIKAYDMKKAFLSAQENISGSGAKKAFDEEFDHQFSGYLTRMILVFAPDSVRSENLSEDDRELCRYTGMWYLEKGDTIKGCRLILRTVGKNISRDEMVPFTQALEAMFKEKMFSDIIFETSERVFDSADDRYPLRVNVYLWYGISLYQQKHYKEALVQLKSAENAGAGESDLYYYIAGSLIALMQNSDAIPYAEKAVASSPKDKKCRALLVLLYNTEGRRKDAERASRGF
jgi:tetratricopeptide (TPR) repeat protein